MSAGKRTTGAALVLSILLLAKWAVADDIMNPVPGFRKVSSDDTQEEGYDSVKTIEANFAPLPHFGEPTEVIVTYYSQFASEMGIEVRAHPDVSLGLDVSPLIASRPGPIARGDEIQFQFTVVPHKVGLLDLAFIAYEPVREAGTRVRVGGYVRTNLLIAPTGETVALATPAASVNNATALGPMPDLLSRGVVFTRDPVPPVGVRPPNFEEQVSKRPKRYTLGVQATVSAVDSKVLTVHSTVWPYHSYEAGIAVEVIHDSNVAVIAVSPSFVGPVRRFEAYEFDVVLEFAGDPGVELVRVGFVTPNPDFGSTDANDRTDRMGQIWAGFSFYVAYDESGQLCFISDNLYWDALQRKEALNIPTKFRDTRNALATKLSRRDSPGMTTHSENFDQVMSAGGRE